MRILYYDCFAGISGDMHLAALVDLGVPADYLHSELAKLQLPGWELRLSPDSKNGIGGTRADVVLSPEPNQESRHNLAGSPAAAKFRLMPARTEPGHPGLSQAHGHEHDHSHHHDHPHGHSHAHAHPATAEGHSHEGQRNYRAIIDLISASSLSAAVKQRSLAIFERVAIAEAKVHSMPVLEVAFHEVGAVDSIIDIVGGAICIDWFKPELILASPPELGGGSVKCAHGRLPVPAPATVEILQGIPVRTGAVPFEMTTPTGAAILAASVDRFSESERLTIHKTGYGIGHRSVAIPNVLRVFLAELVPSTDNQVWQNLGDYSRDTVIECNIDDMSGESLGALLETLLAAGASDAWHTPIIMKKSRPALTLSVLCSSGQAPAIAETILRETSSFGLRSYPVDKLAMQRRTDDFASSLGSLPVKSGWLQGQEIKAKPEYEDCRRIALATGRPLREVINIIQGEIDARR